MTKNNAPEDRDNFELRKCNSEDFDGHTAFSEMTPEQRLLWLSHAAEFAYQVRKDRDSDNKA